MASRDPRLHLHMMEPVWEYFQHCVQSPPGLLLENLKRKQNDEQKGCLIIGSNKKPLRTWCGEAINVQMMFEAGQNENNYVVAPAR